MKSDIPIIWILSKTVMVIWIVFKHCLWIAILSSFFENYSFSMNKETGKSNKSYEVVCWNRTLWLTSWKLEITIYE